MELVEVAKFKTIKSAEKAVAKLRRAGIDYRGNVRGGYFTIEVPRSKVYRAEKILRP